MQNLKDFKNWDYTNIKDILYKQVCEGIFEFEESTIKGMSYKHGEVFETHEEEIHIIYKDITPNEYFNETHLQSLIEKDYIKWYEDFNCNMYELYLFLKECMYK